MEEERTLPRRRGVSTAPMAGAAAFVVVASDG
jgi:hypothetical protein